jgi:hypothetical protein
MEHGSSSVDASIPVSSRNVVQVSNAPACMKRYGWINWRAGSSRAAAPA